MREVMGERESKCLMGTRLQFGKIRKFWRQMVGMIANNMNVLNATERCTQKWLRWSILCIDALHRYQ